MLMNKTEKEIEDYLKEQDWFSNLIENMKNENNGTLSGTANSLLKGEFGKETILYAFDWNETKEGFHFWRRIDKSFRKWFKS